ANGSGNLTWTVQDSGGTSNGGVDTLTENLAITVSAVNDAPVAANDAYTTSEDTPLTTGAGLGLLANDTDIDGDGLTAVLVTGPAHGALSLSSDGAFTYTPVANYHGSDSFTYRANDGTADSNLVTVSLTITAVNDAPVAV